jgi:DNA-3-methyladenine glycosylase I
VARFDERRIARLLEDPGIVRNRLKVTSAVGNARACLQVAAEHGSLARYLWQFVDHCPVQNRWRRLADVPSETEVSRRMSGDLRRRGFRFVGPTICYAFMQATGMVNDHIVGCFRHPEVAGLATSMRSPA